MKKLITIILLLIFSSSCHYQECVKKVTNFKHELRKFNTKTSISESSSGFYFLIVGSYSHTKEEKTTVRFYFKNVQGEYQFMERPFEEVNIKIEPNIKIPYVTFVYSSSGNLCDQTSLYKYYVVKTIIHCRESDFQPDININDLK